MSEFGPVKRNWLWVILVISYSPSVVVSWSLIHHARGWWVVVDQHPCFRSSDTFSPNEWDHHTWSNLRYLERSVATIWLVLHSKQSRLLPFYLLNINKHCGILGGEEAVDCRTDRLAREWQTDRPRIGALSSTWSLTTRWFIMRPSLARTQPCASLLWENSTKAYLSRAMQFTCTEHVDVGRCEVTVFYTITCAQTNNNICPEDSQCQLSSEHKFYIKQSQH